MEDLTQMEMRIGDNICKLIKQIYYPNDKWAAVHKHVSAKFNSFKQIMRKIYPEILEITDIMSRVHTLDENYIRHIFNSYVDPDTEKASSKQTAKYAPNVMWVPISVERVELLEAIRQITVNEAIIDVKEYALERTG